MRNVIRGMHTMFYSSDASALRALLISSRHVCVQSSRPPHNKSARPSAHAGSRTEMSDVPRECAWS